MNKEINIVYMDFDGCIADTPHHDFGKQQWSDYYGIPYPHIGWWGRLESMDPVAFNIKTHPEQHAEWIKYNALGYKSYIHTSRQPKFEPLIAGILKNNNINVDGILTVKGNITKGERILLEVKSFIENGYVVKNVVFFDDRQKEIVTVEAVKEELNQLGVLIDIIKVESDALD
jgi:hypothetical protein